MQRFFFLLFFLIGSRAFAVTISGEVTDGNSKNFISDVSVINIHTKAGTLTGKDGRFQIAVAKGELLELKKLGYKTVRIRIPAGNIPAYFKITMQEGPIELPEYERYDRTRDFVKDSIRYHELYKTSLDFPKLTGLDVVRHPFSAMSRQNQRKWAFQDEFRRNEQQRYIDYTFNEKLITTLTGLKGDSLVTYMRMYRPSYDWLRGMTEYNFYSYVKKTVSGYRKLYLNRPRSAN